MRQKLNYMGKDDASSLSCNELKRTKLNELYEISPIA
jgi:hypothetical protein